MKRFLLLTALFLLSGLLSARNREADTVRYSAEYLDTVQLRKGMIINDYTTLGVNAGVTLSTMLFNPVKESSFLFSPEYFSLYYTRHCKMFGYLPYFALKIGAEYSHSGFEFKTDKNTGRTYHDNGITKCDMRVVTVPAMAEIHVDVDPIKIFADVGAYGGYRLTVNRSWPSSQDAYIDAKYHTAFKDYENRWEYGLHGGAGVAFLFSPVEIHLGAMVRWSWSDLYQPDYLDEQYHPYPRNTYYYRFAAPLDIMIYAGVHFQLTKRKGKTARMLRREAYDIVYPKPLEESENAAPTVPQSQGR
ncbi:MAG: outer membrane beta-barrel protein [Bacteroidales bacterium]|nr:outer membrane beta-barrel protein [Bacteroidales bacterium]